MEESEGDELLNGSATESSDLERIADNDSKKLKLLIVDDDADYLAALKENLPDLEIDTAVTGLEGLELALSNDYDRIVFNLVLGDEEFYENEPIDGMGYVKKLREAKPDAHIITTCSTACFIPEPELKCQHIQKKTFLSAHDSFAFINLLNKGHSMYTFCTLPSAKEGLNLVAGLKDLIENEEIGKLKTMTNIPHLGTMVEDEIKLVRGAHGRREGGYITGKTAIYSVILREFIFRHLGEQDGIENLQEKVWGVINEGDAGGTAISIREAYLTVRDNEKRKKTKRGPYVLVFGGPTAVGKTTIALALEKILTERDMPTVYIGNIKTGPKRKGLPPEEDRDEYVSERQADKLEKDKNFSTYDFLDRRYFSKDSEIIAALEEGKNVILVRNTAGLKCAGKLIYEIRDQIPAKLISFRLHAGEETLKDRLGTRVEDKIISATEFVEREYALDLRKTWVEYMGTDSPFDFVVPTGVPHLETQGIVLEHFDNVAKENPNLHFEFSNYARDVMRLLADDRFYTRADFEKELDREPVIIRPDIPEIDNVEIVKAQGYHGIYTFYLNPFYSKETVHLKRDFLKYLENLLNEKAETFNVVYEPCPASNYAKTTVSYTNNRKIRTDDIALFTLKKGISTKFAGDEAHTVAFVCLEDKPKKSSAIKIKGI